MGIRFRSVASVVGGVSKSQQAVSAGSPYSVGCCNSNQDLATVQWWLQDSFIRSFLRPRNNPFKKEALEVRKLGKQLGVSFVSGHTSQTYCSSSLSFRKGLEE